MTDGPTPEEPQPASEQPTTPAEVTQSANKSDIIRHWKPLRYEVPGAELPKLTEDELKESFPFLDALKVDTTDGGSVSLFDILTRPEEPAKPFTGEKLSSTARWRARRPETAGGGLTPDEINEMRPFIDALRVNTDKGTVGIMEILNAGSEGNEDDDAQGTSNATPPTEQTPPGEEHIV